MLFIQLLVHPSHLLLRCLVFFVLEGIQLFLDIVHFLQIVSLAVDVLLQKVFFVESPAVLEESDHVYQPVPVCLRNATVLAESVTADDELSLESGHWFFGDVFPVLQLGCPTGFVVLRVFSVVFHFLQLLLILQFLLLLLLLGLFLPASEPFPFHQSLVE